MASTPDAWGTSVVDLRPLGFTDILDGAFALYRAGLRVMAPLVLLVMVPLQLLAAYQVREALSFGVTGILNDPVAAAVLLEQQGPTAGLGLNLLAQLVIAPVLGGALVAAALGLYRGEAVTLSTTVAQALRHAGWLILAYLATLVARGLPIVAVALALLWGSPVAIGSSVAIAGILLVLATPVFVLVFPALLTADRPPVDAVVHAVTLVRHAYLRTAGIMVGTTAVFGLLALVLAGVPNLIGVLAPWGFSWVLVAAASVLAQLIVAPLTASAMVLLHADLRIRQEGMDFDAALARMAPAGGGVR